MKVKILEMEYKQDGHLFMMKVKNIAEDKEMTFAISADDFGIPKGFPIEAIQQFCSDMRGKEKNLHIQIEGSSIKDLKRDEQGCVLPGEMEKMHGELDRYSVDKIINNLDIEENNED